ncbi:25220_t:CDS:1 [Dentiscutata erythropus]|uniref:25220_t:CDS:1 n=1 Tax=Dentiscutata erythropus TaxID=1348616 RepID=A0A9N9H124_9GLOM|nr:25220_t:CDS:1 [Dentiscutata erythropus]
MNTSSNLRSNRQKGLPSIPFQYHEAYDDRYRTAGRDTYIVNDEYIENEQPEIPLPIPEKNTFLIDERSDNDEYEESNPESFISSPNNENNDRPLSPPLSPKENTYDLYNNEISKTSSMSPTNNNNIIEKSLPLDYQSQQKRKNYFNLGKTLTSRFKFKKPNNVKDIQNRSLSDPISEKSQSLLSSLPTLAPSSPISHQLPAEYFPDDFEKDEETKSVEQTAPELTVDDLYHFVLNIQKGFQLQFNDMNSQIKELKKEIRKLKGEESEDEAQQEETQEEEVNSATNVRSVTRQMERYGGAGRWFHNDNNDYI